MAPARRDRKLPGWLLGIGAAAAGIGAAALGRRAIRRYLQDVEQRGDSATRGLGYAPAPGSHPERFQHQLYRELLGRLEAVRPLVPSLRLAEIGCGRGGGLNAFLAAAPGAFDAVGIDDDSDAIAFCRRTYGESERLHFIEAGTGYLPFPDSAFDVVIGVEASAGFAGDLAEYAAEVARVLKRGGVFLHADCIEASAAGTVKRTLDEAGFDARFEDLTPNVLEACRLDTPRRRELIDQRLPGLGGRLFRRRLEEENVVEGSHAFRDLAEGRRRYLATAAVKR